MKNISKILFFMVLFIGLIGTGSKAFASTTTWNPNDKSSNITLSNNDLTVNYTANGGLIRTTTPILPGQKKYLELKIDTSFYITVGVASSEQPLSTRYFFSYPNARGYENWNGYKTTVSEQLAYGSTYTAGDVIGIAVDMVNYELTFYKNGVSQGVASSDLNLLSNVYPAIAFDGGASKITANFGATPFEYNVPDGYIAYDANDVLMSSISLNKTVDNLEVGQIDDLVATTTPSNVSVNWSSSDSSIATVDSNGKVTALKEGIVDITATAIDSGKTATCTVTVTVENIPPVSQGTVLNIEPEKNQIHLNEVVSANLTIDNIQEIAAEDVRIKYDNTKLKFLGMDEIDGIKLVKSEENDGELRVILASKGIANVVNDKKILLKLNFQGIASGEALVDVTKGRVSDGIEMERDLTDSECGQATIIIDDIAILDVNNSGEFTLLDLAIDARHLEEDPTALPQYNTDQVINGAIDNDDLTKIGEYMLANPNYTFN